MKQTQLISCLPAFTSVYLVTLEWLLKTVSTTGLCRRWIANYVVIRHVFDFVQFVSTWSRTTVALMKAYYEMGEFFWGNSQAPMNICLTWSGIFPNRLVTPSEHLLRIGGRLEAASGHLLRIGVRRHLKTQKTPNQRTFPITNTITTHLHKTPVQVARNCHVVDAPLADPDRTSWYTLLCSGMAFTPIFFNR